MITAGVSVAEAARRLERDPSTIHRELALNRDGAYDAEAAQAAATARARRPKTPKLAADGACPRVWVPIIRSWALTRGFALHPGTRNRYEIRDTRTQHRPASRLWVPIIRSWALTRGFALRPGTRNRYMMRYTRTQHRPA